MNKEIDQNHQQKDLNNLTELDKYRQENIVAFGMTRKGIERIAKKLLERDKGTDIFDGDQE